MKEQGKDYAEYGFKVPGDGWHVVEFGQGIDYLKAKGGESDWQDDSGDKAYKFPAKVIDPEGPDNDADISQIFGIPKGGGALADILAAVGLWDAVVKNFPGDDVSVFDKTVMDKIKAKLPGRSCMIKTEIDQKGKAQKKAVASMARYKEIAAEEKKKGAGKGKKEEVKKEEGKAEPVGDSWD